MYNNQTLWSIITKEVAGWDDNPASTTMTSLSCDDARRAMASDVTQTRIDDVEGPAMDIIAADWFIVDLIIVGLFYVQLCIAYFSFVFYRLFCKCAVVRWLELKKLTHLLRSDSTALRPMPWLITTMACIGLITVNWMTFVKHRITEYWQCM